MGVPEDIRWLKTNEQGWEKVFRLVAENEGVSYRDLKRRYGGRDWWPLKSCVNLLLERGLVEFTSGGFFLSPYGRKVFDTMRTTEELASV
jgi:coproporphyrinogen III oxidase-like Fe-S oxidoreductase